jgi:putative ABC transport system ATP-binding protein
MMAEKPYIVCDNLVKIYKVDDLEVVALQGLDLTVEREEMLGVIGPSGSGKSTLMNILGGLDRPSAGRAWVGDQDLLKTSNAGLNKYRRTHVGFVWQQSARNLVPYLNALENVTLPMTLAGIKERDKKRWGNKLLEMVGLSDRKRHLLSQMSGGEQQRVAIAVSLANRPGLLLADEPTGEVDEETALTIYETFKALNRQLGITILIVSHDPDITRHVGRVVAIRDGKLATETMRRPGLKNAEILDGRADIDTETEFEELIVLDSAGRLQLPKDYIEQLAIQKRVHLELLEDGIMIRPVSNRPEEQNSHELDENTPDPKDLSSVDKPSGFIRKTINRFRTKSRKKPESDTPIENDLPSEKKT